MEAIVSLITGSMCILSFIIGRRAGCGEKAEHKEARPRLSPSEHRRMREEREAARKDAELLSAVLENIDNYDGTPRGQRELPRG